MDVVALVGRILFALLFLGSAFGHFTQSDQMAGYAQSKRVPAPRVAVLGTGVLQLIGALLVALGVWGDLGALLLVVFLIPTAVIMHGFWAETDPTARQTEMTQFLKDISLAGAALTLIALFAVGNIGLTLTGPLFG
jgi:uncharacterized membrane protein YphA (DoxX/SURF4 family)